jgi:hypothetical protein
MTALRLFGLSTAYGSTPPVALSARALSSRALAPARFVPCPRAPSRPLASPPEINYNAD